MSGEPAPIEIERFVNVPGRGLVRMDKESVAAPIDQPPEVVADVYSALRRGDLASAQKAMQGLELQNSEAHHLTGCRVFWLMLEGDINKAHEMLGELDDDALSHDAVVTAKAAVLLVSGQGDEASRLLAGVVERHPRHELGRYLQALYRAQNGDLQAAHDVLIELCRDFPDHALGRLQLGQVLMAAGDIARAGTLFEAAIDLSPELAQAWERFAALLVLGGQPMEAMTVAKRGIEKHPGSRPLLEVLARSALAVGATEMALDATRLVLASARDDAVAFANHAVALTAAGQKKTAQDLVKEARELFPEDAGLKQLEQEITASS